MTEASAYPRPQLERADWTSLDGAWDFAFDPDACWSEPTDVGWDRTIQVPFAPETAASGSHDTGFYRACWYRRRFDVPPLPPGEHLLLHFGAVDYAATVWVNGELAACHEGGYTPFTADVTRLLAATGCQTVVVRAEDDPQDLAKPRGKQDWQLNPHLIWYPRTTGIWQTVWLERVGAAWIDSLRWLPDLDCWQIGVEAHLGGLPLQGLRVAVTLRAGELLLADDVYSVTNSTVTRRIALADPGIDDYRNELLWSPRRPRLIQAELTLRDAAGAPLDTVRSYTALRTVGTQG